MSKGQAYAYQVDLSKREEIYQMAQRVKREVGKVKITFDLFRKLNKLLIFLFIRYLF